MTAGGERLPVRVSTAYERFPATIKGAFVMRGADGLPHAVRLEEAALARIPRGPLAPIARAEVLVDVAPTQDLFVPFEVPTTDLQPGWYEIRSVVQVDGIRRYAFTGRPFVVSWPRDRMLKGRVDVGASLRAGEVDVEVDRIDMRTDLAEVVWRAATGDPGATIVLLVHGEPLEQLPETAAGHAGPLRPGERRSLWYPVPADARALGLVARLPSGTESAPLQIATGAL